MAQSMKGAIEMHVEETREKAKQYSRRVSDYHSKLKTGHDGQRAYKTKRDWHGHPDDQETLAVLPAGTLVLVTDWTPDEQWYKITHHGVGWGWVHRLVLFDAKEVKKEVETQKFNINNLLLGCLITGIITTLACAMCSRMNYIAATESPLEAMNTLFSGAGDVYDAWIILGIWVPGICAVVAGLCVLVTGAEVLGLCSHGPWAEVFHLAPTTPGASRAVQLDPKTTKMLREEISATVPAPAEAMESQGSDEETMYGDSVSADEWPSWVRHGKAAVSTVLGAKSVYLFAATAIEPMCLQGATDVVMPKTTLHEIGVPDQIVGALGIHDITEGNDDYKEGANATEPLADTPSVGSRLLSAVVATAYAGFRTVKNNRLKLLAASGAGTCAEAADMKIKQFIQLKCMLAHGTMNKQQMQTTFDMAKGQFGAYGAAAAIVSSSPDRAGAEAVVKEVSPKVYKLMKATGAIKGGDDSSEDEDLVTVIHEAGGEMLGEHNMKSLLKYEEQGRAMRDKAEAAVSSAEGAVDNAKSQANNAVSQARGQYAKAASQARGMLIQANR